jgi:hypothetical protein
VGKGPTEFIRKIVMNPIEQQFFNDLEKKLWTAADKLRSNLDAARPAFHQHANPGLHLAFNQSARSPMKFATMSASNSCLPPWKPQVPIRRRYSKPPVGQ